MNEPAADPARRRKATLALLLVTLLWGWTFVWMKQALIAAEAHLGVAGSRAAIGLFIAQRFGLALLVLPLARPRLLTRISRSVWRGGALLGTLLLSGFLLQMLGLGGVSPAVSAFLTSLYVLFTALLQVALQRRPLGPFLWIGAVLATLGAGFIDGPPQLSFGLAEWLTVACAFVFALHILATDAVTKRVDPLAVTWVSFAWTAMGGVFVLIWALSRTAGPTAHQLRRLSFDPAFLLPVALSSVLATALALSLMNVYQRELAPMRAAILYALEPIWAAAIALVLGLQPLSTWLFAGGAALLGGNLIAEWGAAAYGRQRGNQPELRRRGREPHEE